jgi:UDP-glucose 4-epimerase
MEKMLIFGGTGSLGKTLLAHFIDAYEVYVFSRDEAKHVKIKKMYPKVKSLIGDVRDRDAVFNAVLQVQPNIIINAAALKNVPEVEEVPMEGIKTSLTGTENINMAVKMAGRPLKVLTVSTDKAAAPVNSYGMAKALQERLHIRSNGNGLVCNAVRYGNVLQSRGSLIPLLKQRFESGEPVYITHPEMTRFFMTLDSSVQLIKTALADDEGGKIFVPTIKSARIADVIDIFREAYGVDPSNVGVGKIRPGEKLAEVLVCKEELSRTELVGDVYVIHDILTSKEFSDIDAVYSSDSPSVLLERDALVEFLKESGVLDG